MASGKLSPRQKMINMMYLVLTALLALNVSAEILEAFKSLRDSLHDSAINASKKNTDTKDAIIAKVDEELADKNDKNEWIKAATKRITEMTDKIITEIDKDIVKLEEIAEPEGPEKRDYANMKETEYNFQYWMIGPGGDETANNGRGGGKAQELHKELDDWVIEVTKFITDRDKIDSVKGKPSVEIKKLVMDPKEDPRASKNSEHYNDTWEYFTFHGKPVIADMAYLEKIKLDIYEREYEVLTWLKQKLGQVTFKIDSLIAISAPESRVVAAGMKFKTLLYVAMSSKDITPEFSSGSGAITHPDGDMNVGELTINAMGNFAPNTNEKEQSYSALITVPKADGTKALLKVEEKFIVRKPEVVITSASVQNLYQFCGNKLNVDVPALGDLYDPRFSGTDAECITDPSKKKVVTVVPRGTTCNLSVSSNTNGQIIPIDVIKYKVIKPPRPMIEVLVDGAVYNGSSPINKKSTITIKIKADGDFLASLPEDARYGVGNCDLYAQRSIGSPTKLSNAAGRGSELKFELGSLLKSDPPGTKIFFEIEKINRINFQKKAVQEPFSRRELVVNAIVK